MAREPGQTPGASEYSWGKGLMPPFDKVDDFGTRLPSGVGGDKDEQWHQIVAEKRTDSTDATSVLDYRVQGNPDRFGGNPALILEDGVLSKPEVDVFAPGGVIGAKPRTGVIREG